MFLVPTIVMKKRKESICHWFQDAQHFGLIINLNKNKKHDESGSSFLFSEIEERLE